MKFKAAFDKQAKNINTHLWEDLDVIDKIFNTLICKNCKSVMVEMKYYPNEYYIYGEKTLTCDEILLEDIIK